MRRGDGDGNLAPSCHSSRKEGGGTAIEYGLIAPLISVVIIATITAVGTRLQTTFNTGTTALAGANGGRGTHRAQERRARSFDPVTYQASAPPRKSAGLFFAALTTSE